MKMKGSEVSDGEDENLRVDFSELEMIERIGSGAFGEIYKCRWRGILVAAKCIKASKIQKGWLLKKQSRSIADRVEAISQARITDEEKELALEGRRLSEGNSHHETIASSQYCHDVGLLSHRRCGGDDIGNMPLFSIGHLQGQFH